MRSSLVTTLVAGMLSVAVSHAASWAERAAEVEAPLTAMVSLRTLSIHEPARVVDRFGSRLAVGTVSGRPAPEVLAWFMANTMVIPRAAGSQRPQAFYYNPLVDVVLMTQWSRQEDRVGLVESYLVPGDGLSAESEGASGIYPTWLTAESDDALTRLRRLTESRVEALSSPLVSLSPMNGSASEIAETRLLAQVADLHRALQNERLHGALDRLFSGLEESSEGSEGPELTVDAIYSHGPFHLAVFSRTEDGHRYLLLPLHDRDGSYHAGTPSTIDLRETTP